MSIYQPAEDSIFLSEFVEKFAKMSKPNKILDIGSGTGIQAKTCIESGANPKNIFLSDINSEAVKFLNKEFPKSKIIQSDLFDKIPKQKFNLIIFNPPYLPEDFRESHESRLATTGGKKGSELINNFLIQAKNYLDSDGKILLLTSSLTKGIKWQNWKKKLLRKKKIFFEELYVWELNH